MAIEYDISGLLGKVENDGATDAGRLTAAEFNRLVQAVGEVQDKVEGTIKGIIYKGGPDNGGQFFNKIDSNGYLQMDVVDPTGDVTINVTKKPNEYISSDASCEVAFTVSSKILEGENNVSAPIACKANVYLDNGSGTDVLVLSDSIFDIDQAGSDKKTEISIDFAKLSNITLGKGSGITNKITIEVNNGYGKTIRAYVVVNVIELSLQVERFGTTTVYNETNPPMVQLIVYGNPAKIYAEVDNTTIIGGEEIPVGVVRRFPTDIFTNVNTHGVHNIKIWAAVEMPNANDPDNPIVIRSKTSEYNYIYGTSNANPIVMANITNKKPEQYSNFNVAYDAYKYNASNVAINETVRTAIYELNGFDDDNEPILGRELIGVDQILSFDSSTCSASGSASLPLFPVTLVDNDGKAEEVVLLGDVAVVITIGDYSYIDTINIIPSSIVLNEIPDYAVKLTSAGKTNVDKTWISNTGIDVAGKPVIAEMFFDENIEFTETGSGWLYDGDKYDINDPLDKGNIALRLRKNRYCTLNYKPFATNPTYLSDGNAGTGNGLTISIEFATRNSLNQSASVISCLANDNLGKPRGFEILANKATLYSNNVELYADFKEDTRIKIDFVIDGQQYPYKYDTVITEDGGKGDTVTQQGTDNEALCFIYVDGVYQALAIIPSGTSFLQSGGGVPIKFGSSECDLDIYNIRIYNQALNPIQIVQNYGYDTPNIKNKFAIAQRNHNVLTVVQSTPHHPNINIEGLRQARPELPFFYVEMDTTADPEEVLPKDKKKWKLMKMTQYKNPVNDASLLEGNPSFEVPYSVLRNQGTSSMTYPWPWRNWDWKTKDDDFAESADAGGYYYMPTVDNPIQKIKYWPQYKGMDNIDNTTHKGNIRKITLKKDYASSEMCNNAITSELFTDMALGIADAQPGVLSPAQANSGGKNSPYRLTFVATPCVMFRKYSDITKQGTAGAGHEMLGMMNLIPNKNECGYLGFYGNYEWEKNRSQSWELSDNYPEIFWKTKLDGVKRNSDGTYSNDVDGNYEARYPKDTTVFKDSAGEFDGDFGMVKGDTITSEQEGKVRNEQTDLIDFHNWLVSTNRQLAVENKAANGGEWLRLTPEQMNTASNLHSETGAVLYEFDTPEYRLNKFKREAPSRMLVDQFAMYYIWREMMWAYDSGFKNLQIYTMGPAKDENGELYPYMQWGCMVRDADTTLGIQNQGRAEFGPYLEDTDYYVLVDGKKEWHYDELKECYDEADITSLGGAHILNGQLGALWINMRDAFSDRIEAVYTSLSENSSKTNWSASRAIKRFNDHQAKWCESLYNFGMRQYFGGAPFTAWINSGLGDKKNSRASWLSQAFYYRDSKYKVLSDDAAFRAGCYETNDFADGHTQNQPLKFKLYQPAYLCLGANKIDCKEIQTHRRVVNIDDYVDVYPTEMRLPIGFNSAMGVQFGTTNMIEIGDLARVCKIFEIQEWNFPKLRALNLGHEPDRDGKTYYEKVKIGEEFVDQPISNTSLSKIDLSSFKQLQLLDITNHKTIGNINVSYCTELQELYARGCTSTRTIELPQTTTLRTIYLPSSITSIKLVGLKGIEKFVLDSPDTGDNYAITRVEIKDSGDYIARESYKLIKQVLPTLESVYHPEEANDVCILENINWTKTETGNDGDQIIERLLAINAKLSGKIELNRLNNALKVKLKNAYGDIDDPTNGLYITYTQSEITSAKMSSKYYIYTPGDHQLSFSVTPESANTYDSAVWEISTNKYLSVKDAEKGIFTRTVEAADETVSAEIKVTIKQLPRKDGSLRDDIVLTSIVYFYERVAKPGDFVFNDGTFSDELDSNKTPIGICFYVDPNNKENRLMCALDSVGSGTRYSWGAMPGFDYPSDGRTQYYGTSPILSIADPSYNCFNIKSISDLSSSGTGFDSGVDNTVIFYSDDNYRDSTNAKNEYFKAFEKSTYFGDLGWKTANNEIRVDGITLPDGAKSIVINKDAKVPSGYYNTLAIIEHRNKLLDAYENTKEQEGAFIRPYSTEDYSELYILNNLISEAETWAYEDRDPSTDETGGSSLYYGAASACFAYEPSGVNNLADKFKKYNWFLPAAGDLVRLLYFVYQSYKDGKAQETPVNSIYDNAYNIPANAFYNAINSYNKFMVKNFVGNTAWSSTEAGEYAISITANNGKFGIDAKFTSAPGDKIVIPICVF